MLRCCPKREVNKRLSCPLDGDDFLSLVNNSVKTGVEIKMPKYTLDYQLNMNDV